MEDCCRLQAADLHAFTTLQTRTFGREMMIYARGRHMGHGYSVLVIDDQMCTNLPLVLLCFMSSWHTRLSSSCSLPTVESGVRLG